MESIANLFKIMDGKPGWRDRKLQEKPSCRDGKQVAIKMFQSNDYQCELQVYAII